MLFVRGLYSLNLDRSVKNQTASSQSHLHTRIASSCIVKSIFTLLFSLCELLTQSENRWKSLNCHFLHKCLWLGTPLTILHENRVAYNVVSTIMAVTKLTGLLFPSKTSSCVNWSRQVSNGTGSLLLLDCQRKSMTARISQDYTVYQFLPWELADRYPKMFRTGMSSSCKLYTEENS